MQSAPSLSSPSLPEVHWRDASPRTIASLYEAHGMVVIRQLFAGPQTQLLASVAQAAFAIGDLTAALLPTDKLPEDLLLGLVRNGWLTWPRAMDWLRMLGFKGHPKLSEMLRTVEATAADLYGRKCRILEDVSSFRRHRGHDAGQAATVSGYGAQTHEGGTLVPWHRDIAVAGTSRFGKNAVNFWVPLADVGEYAPSLELVVGSHNYMKSIPAGGPGELIENLTTGWIEQHLPDAPRWTPHCKLGDVIVFDHQTIHQTQLLQGPTRLSLELRCAPV